MKRRNRKKAEILNELEDNPIIVRACKKLSIHRSTFYRWCLEDREFQSDVGKALEKGRDRITDFAESKLIENIGANNHQAIVFWLKHNTTRFRPPAIKLYVEDNAKQKQDIDKLVNIFFKIANRIGTDEALSAMGYDPKVFREEITNDLESLNSSSDEL